MKLEVYPYLGPHIHVGTDEITIAINYGMDPKVIQFKHIESVPLPPNYKPIIKKWPLL